MKAEYERKLALAEDALFDLWHTNAQMQTETARNFERVMTGSDLRTPAADEVRGYLRAVLRGALLPPPPPKRPWWRKVIDYLTKWEDQT